MMTNLALLLTHKHRLISIAAILDIFESVNGFYTAQGLPPFFSLQLVIPDQEVYVPVDYGKYQPVMLQEVQDVDLVLIPAFVSEDITAAVAANVRCIPWIQQQYQQGAEIASFCTGAFLLGATGLLNGRRATTHITACTALASSFPEVILQQDKVITADGRIYTSGGATSTFHLLLYLIEKYCDRQIAVEVARMFAIDMDRYTQSYFSAFTPDKRHCDPLIMEAQQRMEACYKNAGNVETIIGDMPASRRNFARRFKQATGITAIEYLQRTRIEAAKRLLEQTIESVTSIMLDCGYNDIKAFRELFKKEVGITPSEYRMKFAPGRFHAGAPANREVVAEN